MNEISEQELSAQLKTYVHKMQSKVGKSGKTLHEVFSEYLALKDQQPSLAEKMAAFEMPQSNEITEAQAKLHLETIKKLKDLGQKSLGGINRLDMHPWFGFAHPNLDIEDLEPLQRAIRFAHISIKNFWIELNSFPVLLQAMAQMSLTQASHLLEWFAQSPSYQELHPFSKLIPALTQPNYTKKVLHFLADLERLQEIQQTLSKKVSKEKLDKDHFNHTHHLLEQASNIVDALNIHDVYPLDLEEWIEQSHSKMQAIEQVQAFQANIENLHFPPMKDLTDFQACLKAIEICHHMNHTILEWRNPNWFGAYETIFQLKQKALPLLELYEQLEKHFHLESQMSIETLTDLSQHLYSKNLLKKLTKTYHQAKKTYFSILKHPNLCDESDQQMAEWLMKWAFFLKKTNALDSQLEFQNLFGKHFKGIHSDFDAAFATLDWQEQQRIKWTYYQLDDSEKFLDSILRLPSKNIKQLACYFDQLPSLYHLLSDELFCASQPLNAQFEQHTVYHNNLLSLSTIISSLKLQPEQSLGYLKNDYKLSCEYLDILQKFETDEDLKKILSGLYAAEKSQAHLIEKILHYIQNITAADLPQCFKDSFLSAKGPIRYTEHKELAQKAQTAILHAKQHYDNLQTLSCRFFELIADLPIPLLLERMQNALKQASLLEGYLQYLRCEQDVRKLGLSEVLDFFQKKSLAIDSFEIAYGLALNGSLLKKAIQG